MPMLTIPFLCVFHYPDNPPLLLDCVHRVGAASTQVAIYSMYFDCLVVALHPCLHLPLHRQLQKTG